MRKLSEFKEERRGAFCKVCEEVFIDDTAGFDLKKCPNEGCNFFLMMFKSPLAAEEYKKSGGPGHGK